MLAEPWAEDVKRWAQMDKYEVGPSQGNMSAI